MFLFPADKANELNTDGHLKLPNKCIMNKGC